MSDNESEPEPLSEHEILPEEDDFKIDPEEEKKHEESRKKLQEEKQKLVEEEKKVQAAKKKQLKIERLQKKIKKYDNMSNSEQEIAEVAKKYSEDRFSRAQYFYYKKELMLKKLNMINGKEINDHMNNGPMSTEERTKLVNFEQQLQSAFGAKKDKNIIKHMISKKYIR